MENGQYYIYEISDGGIVKKALKHGFRSKEEAEKSIKVLMHPIDRRRLIAVKVE